MEDIPLLIEYFSKLFSITDVQIPLEVFSNYNWPGNIRELQNEVKRFVVLGEKQTIGNGLNKNCLNNNGNNSLSSKMDEYEKMQIIEALRICHNIKSKAAKMLNIPEATLHRKIRIYNIHL